MVEKDLISRSALLKEIKLQKSYAGEMRQQSYRTGFIVSLSMLEGKIAEIPVVDAEPVRHGLWGECRITGYDGLHAVYTRQCSECGHESRFITRYCPVCGARMGAEVKE